MKIVVADTQNLPESYRVFVLSDASTFNKSFLLGLGDCFVRVYDPDSKQNYWFNTNYIMAVVSDGPSNDPELNK